MQENSIQHTENILESTVPTTEACKMLQVTPKTLRLWRLSGRIPAVEYPPATYRYYKKDIEKILKEGF